MNRTELEKRAIRELEDDGYTCERAYNKAVFIPKKGYIAKSYDFFHVVDIIALKGNEVKFIQVTSENASPDSKHHSSNGSDSVYNHKKKIEQYWPFDLPLELWAYEKIKNRWYLKTEIFYKGQWHKDIICSYLMGEVNEQN